eukprot:Amastigsp_a340791_30.p7 type:complete len:105 gc:universal Amastigsp_a340791_30:2347-2033(-)
MGRHEPDDDCRVHCSGCGLGCALRATEQGRRRHHVDRVGAQGRRWSGRIQRRARRPPMARCGGQAAVVESSGPGSRLTREPCTRRQYAPGRRFGCTPGARATAR